MYSGQLSSVNRSQTGVVVFFSRLVLSFLLSHKLYVYVLLCIHMSAFSDVCQIVYYAINEMKKQLPNKKLTASRRGVRPSFGDIPLKDLSVSKRACPSVSKRVQAFPST